MDYFSKFKKRIIPPKVQLTAAMQLAKFHKCWDYVHNIFIAEDRKANLHVKQTEIPERLRHMVDMLVNEEAQQEDNTTGVCMEYFLKNGILQYLVNVSEKMDYPEGIRGEAIRTIASMVDLLDDRFLVHNAVHKPTIKLLRFCVLDERQSELYHEDLVDLMYIICSKIHGFPALLNIFFHDKQWLTTPQKPSPPVPATLPQNTIPEYEFLLFTYLLRFVHREGRSGDFARTGLLFLMEMATHQLGDFILESDFATIMSAGLGALYSQLPRKLIIKDDTEINSTPASYLLGQDLDLRMYPSEELGVEQSNSEQFKYQLDSFLKLLEFCQDILIRCPNDAISERLLQCIRMIFLENILYPSILECSDIDGSSVAVVSYIDLILQTVQQQNLAIVIVGFLMDASDDDDEITNKLTSPISPTNNLFAGVEFDRFKSSPYFTAAERFTLKDLIFSRLKSSSQPTVIATLKLLKTLIVKHCRFANRLLSTCPDINPTATNEEENGIASTMIISHHIREIELYFSLISAIDQVHADDILGFGYENYLYDIEVQMNQDHCFQHATQQPETHTSSSKSEKRRSFKYGQRSSADFLQQQQRQNNTITQRQRHRIRPTDTLIQILLGLLSHFFAQTPELNLALTGVISSLAICPYRSLEGWISFCESDRTHANDVLNLSSTHHHHHLPTPQEDGIKVDEIYALSAIQEQEREQGQDDDQSVDFGAERNSIRMTAPTQFKSFPPFYTLLRTLTQQIDYYRSEVDEFDRLLDERWNGLLFGESTAHCSVPGTPIPTHANVRRTFDQPTTSPKIFGQRRNSLGLLKASVSSSTTHTNNMVPPPNPSKSLSSSTTAAAMAVGGSGGGGGNGGGTMVTSTSSSTNTPTHTTTTTAPPIINPLSPLAIHAKKTLQVRIQPLFPSNFEIDRDEPILNLDEEDEDTFAPQPTTNPSQRKKMDKTTEISLSMLLNNVVILEETIKELVAIMQVRRSLGIDRIRYT
ncbi:hypothetical protein INT48_009136 [Thamnidium elegans]|uniref:FHF complex subunit HOOK-interacting protein C-terminal domain-containing protein n=1 Tax=Thamnidium elegans TaxID=101142 RepID=A0A8H7SVA5_9FUNG|nr:hypothetical protein INT48_009136 [Thamnidium elegans]